MTTLTTRVGIAGAGIMGRLLAWQLVQNGFSVTLFDKDPIGTGSAAAFSAAGMLSPFSEIESAELTIFNIGINSLAIWPKIIQQLNIDSQFQQLGSLVVSHVNDQPELNRFNQRLEYKLAINTKGMTSTSPQILNQQSLYQLEPELADNFSCATFLPQEAWLNPQSVMDGLATQLLEAGVSWIPHSQVDEILSASITVNRQQYQFDWVIDCRGMGAKKDRQSLRAVRGELLVLRAPDVQINRQVRLMHPRYQLYLAPWGNDDLYTIGATQIECEDYQPIRVRSSLELLSAAYSLHPGFAEASIVESRANCRPAFPNNLPKIQVEDRLVSINGLFRHGFLIAPSLAQEVCGLLQNEHHYSSKFPELIQREVN